MATPRTYTRLGNTEYDWLPMGGTQHVALFGERVTQQTRPGVDNADFHQMGRRADPFRVNVFTDGRTASALRQIYNELLTYRGQLIWYQDHNGRLWENVLLIEVSNVRIDTLLAGSGFNELVANSKFGLWVSLLMQLTTDDYTE